APGRSVGTPATAVDSSCTEAVTAATWALICAFSWSSAAGAGDGPTFRSFPRSLMLVRTPSVAAPPDSAQAAACDEAEEPPLGEAVPPESSDELHPWSVRSAPID